MTETTSPQYLRLPGRAGNYFSLFIRERQQLWLGPDHLLVLIRTPYSERHLKFRLRDVQALTVSRTTASRYITMGFTVCIALVGIGAQRAYEAGAGFGSAFFFGGLLLVTLAGLAVHLRLGPTCRCHLVTAAGQYRLRCLDRERTALRLLERLSPAIERWQESPTAAPAMDTVDMPRPE